MSWLHLPERSVERQASDAAERFLEAARREGAIDVSYATVESPFGPWLVASTKKGIVRLAFSGEDFDEVLEQLSERISPRVLESPHDLDRVRGQLEEYFEGKLKRFDVALDWRLSQGFALRVRRACARIPYGKVSTYKQMATKAGNERASRAAGNALGSNPIPIIVPCHRVLHSGGGLGGYGGGLPMKQRLLELEGAL